MVLTRNQKKQQEIYMVNDAAKTLINMSTTDYISHHKVRPTEQALKEEKAELRKLKLIKEYKYVQESLKKTLLETQNLLNGVNQEIENLINELN